jgi:hypothetical protein
LSAADHGRKSVAWLLARAPPAYDSGALSDSDPCANPRSGGHGRGVPTPEQKIARTERRTYAAREAQGVAVDPQVAA